MVETRRWARAVIRISAPQLGVDEVSRRLGASPRHQFSKSERKMHEAGLWYFWSGLDSGRRPEEHIKVLLEFIRGHMEQLKEITQTYPAELSCSFASSTGEESFKIESDALAVLAEAHVSLFLSLYPPSGTEDLKMIDER